MYGSRIIFGHQSIGEDLLSGITTLAQDIAVHQLNNETLKIQGPGIWHTIIGPNGNPIDKIDKFERLLFDVGGNFELGFLKLCYADIQSDTNIENISSQYNEMVASVVRKHPHLKFIHCTVPLRAVQTGLRFRLYNTLGRCSPVCEDNLRRENFNDLIREKYQESSLFFDLALVESKSGDSEARTTYRHRYMRSLRPEYTDDGGHLNELGKRHVGQHFLKLLKKCGVTKEKRVDPGDRLLTDLSREG